MNPLYSTILELASYPKREAIKQYCSSSNKSLDIHWIVPHFGPGAGGITTILRFVRGFTELGHKCTVWVNILPVHLVETTSDYEEIVNTQYFKVAARFLALPKKIEDLEKSPVIFLLRQTATLAIQQEQRQTSSGSFTSYRIKKSCSTLLALNTF